MAASKEKFQKSTASESYGHVVDGVIFPPGLVSSFAPRRGRKGGALSPTRKEKKIRPFLTPFVFSNPKPQRGRFMQKKAR